MRKFLICSTLLIYGVAMAGCASPKQTFFEKPGATAADTEKDKVACDYDTKKAELAMPNMPRGDMLDNVANSINRGQDLAKLNQLCMQTKGYAVVQR